MPGLCLGAVHTLCPGAIMPGYTSSFSPPSGRCLFRPFPCAWHTACPGDGPLLFPNLFLAQWAAPIPAFPLRLAHCLPRGWAVAFHPALFSVRSKQHSRGTAPDFLLDGPFQAPAWAPSPYCPGICPICLTAYQRSAKMQLLNQ